MGVAGGATRAALVQHQARRDNMADVSAKDGSQVDKSMYTYCMTLTQYMIIGYVGNHSQFSWPHNRNDIDTHCIQQY